MALPGIINGLTRITSGTWTDAAGGAEDVVTLVSTGGLPIDTRAYRILRFSAIVGAITGTTPSVAAAFPRGYWDTTNNIEGSTVGGTDNFASIAASVTAGNLINHVWGIGVATYSNITLGYRAALGNYNYAYFNTPVAAFTSYIIHKAGTWTTWSVTWTLDGVPWAVSGF